MSCHCEEYKKKIDELERRVEVLEKSNAIPPPPLPLLDLTTKRIKSVVEAKYTEELFLLGQKGMAQLVYCHILRDPSGAIAYFMSNRDKKEFKFRGMDNKVYRDTGCNKIFEMIYPIIRKKASKIYLDCINSNDSDSDSDSGMDSDTEEAIIDSIMGIPKDLHPIEEKKEEKEDLRSPEEKEREEKKKKDLIEEEEVELDTLVAALKEIKKADSNKRIFVNELMYYIESKKEF
jgi:hypothetical protein